MDHTDIVAMLLQAKGIDVNQGVNIIISWCLLLPKTTAITNLSYHYLCVVFSAYLLQSPLYWASKNGATEIVTMLLQAKGIDVNQGVNIISWCLPLPKTTAITNLLYHYLCVVFSSYLLQSPLYWASKNGVIEVVAMLLQAKGIDVNKGVNIVISDFTKTIDNYCYH